MRDATLRRCPHCDSGWRDGRVIEPPPVDYKCHSCGWHGIMMNQLVTQLDELLLQLVPRPTVMLAERIGAVMGQLKKLTGAR